jgi:hypothetical protein
MPRPADCPADFKYPTGQKAYAFLPDGSGFVYYPSGRPAVCVSSVSSYQSRYYAYDDAPTPKAVKPSEVLAGKLKEHLLCALDENIVGFAVDNVKGGKNKGTRMVFTASGALVANAAGQVAMEWKWDPSAPNNKPPLDPITVTLNKSLTLIFTDKFNIELRFVCEGAACDFDLGMKLRRTESYLATAVRTGHGGLEPQFARTTLAERSELFNEDMKHKRNLLNPRSEDLGDSVSHIVAGLEKDFDAYAKSHTTTRYLEPSWKTRSKDMTRGEIPPIKLTGAESGHMRGFGDSMYMTPEAYDAAAAVAAEKGRKLDGIPDHLRDKKTGDFIRDFEVTNALKHQNPLLPRTGVLNATSGRYSMDLQVPGGNAHALNPTGKAESLRLPLPTVPGGASQLEDFVANRVPPTQLVCVVCLRDDDRGCRKTAMVTEVVHGMLHRGLAGPGPAQTPKGGGRTTKSAGGGGGGGGATQSFGSTAMASTMSGTGGFGFGGYDPETADIRLIKVDMSQSRFMQTRYRIKTVPFVLMFYEGRVAYGGTLGGEQTKAAAAARPWRVLLVEPNFADQRKAEEVLLKQRNYGKVTWDLAMTGVEAMAAKQRLAASSTMETFEYDVVFVSDKCTDQDVAIIEKGFKASAKGSGSGPGTLLIGMATMRAADGDYEKLTRTSWAPSSPPNMLCTQEASRRALLDPFERLASAVEVAVTKPLKTLQFTALNEVRCVCHLNLLHSIPFRSIPFINCDPK